MKEKKIIVGNETVTADWINTKINEGLSDMEIDDDMLSQEHASIIAEIVMNVLFEADDNYLPF